MPPITRVYKTTRDGKRLTPGAGVFAERQPCPPSPTASSGVPLKHKIGPQEKFCNHYPPLPERCGRRAKRVVKFIGYDAGEGYRSDKVLLGRPGRPQVQQSGIP